MNARFSLNRLSAIVATFLLTTLLGSAATAQQAVQIRRLGPSHPAGQVIRAVQMKSSSTTAAPSQPSQDQNAAANAESPEEKKTPEQELTELLLATQFNRSTKSILTEWAQPTKSETAKTPEKETAKANWDATVLNAFEAFLVVELVTPFDKAKFIPGQTISLLIEGVEYRKAKVLSFENGKLAVSLFPTPKSTQKSDATESNSAEVANGEKKAAGLPKTRVEAEQNDQAAKTVDAKEVTGSQDTAVNDTDAAERPADSDTEKTDATQEEGAKLENVTDLEKEISEEASTLKAGTTLTVRNLPKKVVAKKGEPTKEQKVEQFKKYVTVGDWEKVKEFIAALPESDADRVYAHLLKSLAATNQPELPEGIPPELVQQFTQQLRQSGQQVLTSYLTPDDIIQLSEASPVAIQISRNSTNQSLLSAADPVSGDWQGNLEMGDLNRPFSLSLALKGNSITGSLNGNGQTMNISSGTWDASSGTANLTVSDPDLNASATSNINIAAGKMTGSVSVDGLQFKITATLVAGSGQQTTARVGNSAPKPTDVGDASNEQTTQKTTARKSSAHISALARLIRNSEKAGHDFTEFVNTLEKGSTHFGIDNSTKSLTTADLLMKSRMIDQVERFLPAADDENNSIAALKIWSRLALGNFREKKAAIWLDTAWAVNQKIVSFEGVTDADKNTALTNLIELSPQVEKEIGIAWLNASFTSEPERGMKILSDLGSRSATMAGQAAQVSEQQRFKLLTLQNKTVEDMIEVSPENAVAWRRALTLLAQNWLTEAQTSLQHSRQNSRSNFMQIDMYGNYYWVNDQQMAQRRGGRAQPRPIKLGDMLEIAPGETWRSHVSPSLHTQLTKVLANLHLRVNEEDKAFPFIESLATTRPDIARDLVHEFLRIWTSNHDPNTSRRQTNPYIYMYGFDQKAEAIPLTRSKQERNLKELTDWVNRIRNMNLEEIDETLLAGAFTTCHSSAEVFKLERVRSVFGDLGNLKPDTVAAICQKMRANLSSNWKDIRQQEALQTNRREPEVQQEVLRGYSVAKQLALEALKSAPENWKLHLAVATLLYDENSYAQTVQKSSEFSERRNLAFQQFEVAASMYHQAVPNLELPDQSTEVYDLWFYASLGACDLGKITDKTTPDRRQYKKIREAINNLPGAMAESHMSRFANNLFTRMSPIKPEIKFRYLRGGFEIVEDHPRAWEAKNLYEYYRDLVSEIRLDVTIDGDDQVGHKTPFGVYVNILHTSEIERESGGFGKYVQNQNNMMYAYNYGRPTEDYRDKFTDTVNQALEEHFEVVNITFQSPDTMKSRPASQAGWRVTPYAYVLIKPRGPEVDRVSPLKLDLDFLDTSGYVVIPVESPAVVIDSSDKKGTQRPVSNLQITQTLDERQAEEGKLIVEITATGKGLIPDLTEILDLEREDFEIVSIDDQGVLPASFDKDSDSIQILSDRSWTVEYKAKQDTSGLDQFHFGNSKIEEATVKFQRYEDADLVNVEQTVSLEKQYDTFSWTFLFWLLPLIAIGVVGGIFATVFLAKQPTEQQARFNVPEEINPFTVLTLLNDIKQRNGISVDMSKELESSIERVEQSYFGAKDTSNTENLSELAKTWVNRAK